MAIRTITIPLKSQDAPINVITLSGEVIYDPLQFDPLDKIRLQWMKNVMPTKDGLSTIRGWKYSDTASADTLDPSYCNKVQTRTDANSRKFAYFNFGTKHKILDELGTLHELAGGAGDAQYITYSAFYSPTYGHLLYTHGETTGVFFIASAIGGTRTNFALNGVDTTTFARIFGMCRALNYLIGWDLNTIYWSKPGDFSEFRQVVATVTTGSGQTQIAGLKGYIICCVTTSKGFIIFSSEGAYSATYSGNFDQPFIFTEIQGAGGIIYPDCVDWTESTNETLGWTKAGLQSINLDAATNIFENISNFFQAGVYQDSNNDGTFTNQISQHNIGGQYRPAQCHVKPTTIGNRYLCLSYGKWQAVYNYVLIYDTLLKQWGHIKYDHVDLFEAQELRYQDTLYNYSTSSKPLYGSTFFGFLKTDGKMDAFSYPYNVLTATQKDQISISGEIFIGSIKFTRESRCQLTRIKLYGIIASSVVVYVSTKQQDETVSIAEVAFTVGSSAQGSTTFYGDVIGISHSLRITGEFNITAIEIDVQNAGRKG